MRPCAVRCWVLVIFEAAFGRLTVVERLSNNSAVMQRGVQHRSTATGADEDGSRWTSQDADLREWTQPDALPPVCKQGVVGSSPTSSTGQRPDSNGESASTARKYSSPGQLRCRTRVRSGARFSQQGSERGARKAVAERCCGALSRKKAVPGRWVLVLRPAIRAVGNRLFPG